MEIFRGHLGGLSQVTHRHLHEDGNLFIQSEAVLFKVHERPLCRRSHAISELLSKSRPKVATVGLIALTPVYIENATPRQLLHFFDYLYALEAPNPTNAMHVLEAHETYTTLHDILYVSSLLLVMEGRIYSAKRLAGITGLSPIQRLDIACGYGVDAWFMSAARDVVWQDDRQWTDQELVTIISSLPDFLSIRINFRNRRHRLAYRGPVWTAPVSRACAQSCADKLQLGWDRFVCPVLLFHDDVGPDVDNEVKAACLSGARRGRVCVVCLWPHLEAVAHALQDERTAIDDLLAASRSTVGDPHNRLSAALRRGGYDEKLHRQTGDIVRIGGI